MLEMKKIGFILGGSLLFFGLLWGAVFCGRGMDTGGKITKRTLSSPVDSSVKSINVYLENSGSMDGYVKGNTGFEQSIYAYLSELQIGKIVDTLHLHYVNSRIIPLGHDVEKFIHNIEPTDFRKHGGNLGTSDIAIVLDSILKRHDKNGISIFVSDCIVSPGSKYASSPQNLNNYLLEQRTKIKKTFVQSLECLNGNLSVVICQLTSSFDGKFYNKADCPRYYKGNRPFYIWIIGSTSHIKQMLDKVPLESLKGNGADLDNVCTLVSSSKEFDYRVLLTPRLGSFGFDRTAPKTTICDIRKENKGQQKGMFMFSVGVNLNQLPLDKSYLMDIANYEVSNKDYTLSVKEQKTGRYPYIFNLSSKIASRGNITIMLKKQFPQWVEERTDLLGDDLVKDNATDKTYGLKYLIEGVYEAFKTRQENYAEFKITIK